MGGRWIGEAQGGRPPLTERATGRAVAALAGVSVSTVSRVLNGDPSVDNEIAERVRRAAKQLNYRPNRSASDLRRRDGRPSTIGLLIQDVSNQFSASIFRSVENVAAKHGVAVLASNLDGDPAREHELVETLVARRVSGLLIAPASYDHSYLRPEQRAGLPIVFLDRPPRLLAADSVTSDNRQGSYSGVMHLANRGHRRIAFLGESNSHEPAIDRYRGYLAALQEIGLDADRDIICRNVDTEEDAAEACLSLFSLSWPPTALLTAHNRLTVGAVRALQSAGLTGTTAVVGFDDYELFDLLQPAITVVAQDAAAIGVAGADLLFRRILGERSRYQQVVIPTTLIQRGTGEIAPPTRGSAC